MKKIIAIIQARMGSSRLPGKVMMDLDGEKNIVRVIERVKRSNRITDVIVATSVSRNNDELANYLKENNYNVYRGSEDDVLDRFYMTAKSLNVLPNDILVRITADCPLIDAKVIDKILLQIQLKDADYSSNTNPPTYPDGFDCEAFKMSALSKSWKESKLMSEREHVTPYIRKNSDLFKIINVENDVDLSDIRLTLDDERDYEVLQCLYDLMNDKVNFDLDSIMNILDKNPEIMNKNKNTIRNEGMIKSLSNDKEVL